MGLGSFFCASLGWGCISGDAYYPGFSHHSGPHYRPVPGNPHFPGAPHYPGPNISHSLSLGPSLTASVSPPYPTGINFPPVITQNNTHPNGFTFTDCASGFVQVTFPTPVRARQYVDNTKSVPQADIDLESCITSKGVLLSTVQNCTSGWPQLISPYNLRLPYTPVAIALPNTPQQVADAVSCASQHSYKVQARSGGHSYASYSLGGQDGVLVIDLELFQDVTLDPSSGIVRVGGGVRLGNLALGIFNQGARALPHGTCAGVGIGGHATHGGYGYDSRLWGLTLDTIVELEVVLANGTYVITNSDAYPDLFYAMRGAGDSFGIVTTFWLQTQPAPPIVYNWVLQIPTIVKTKEAAAAAILHLQDFAQNASVVDRNITFGIYIDEFSFTIRGMYFGDHDHFQYFIMPEILRTLPEPINIQIKSLGWIDALTDLNGNNIQEPLTGYNAHDTFFAKSIVTQESQPLTQEALETFFGYMIKNGLSDQNWFVIINLYGGFDSQISAKPTSFAAYPHRSALWVMQLYGYAANNLPPWKPSMATFITELYNSLVNAQPDGEFAGYLNYVDPSLSPTEAHALYYGAELYARLLAFKQEVDPTSVFWNPQAIGTS